jgi:hypothetical protein
MPVSVTWEWTREPDLWAQFPVHTYCETRDGLYWPGVAVSYDYPSDQASDYKIWANGTMIMHVAPSVPGGSLPDLGWVGIRAAVYDVHQSGGLVTLHTEVKDLANHVALQSDLVINGTPAPGAPAVTDLDTESAIRLDWTAPAGGAQGYEVSGGSIAAAATPLNVGNVLTKTDNAPGLVRPVTYTVRAYNVGPDDFSPSSSAGIRSSDPDAWPVVLGPAVNLTVSIPDSVGVLIG